MTWGGSQADSIWKSPGLTTAKQYCQHKNRKLWFTDRKYICIEILIHNNNNRPTAVFLIIFNYELMPRMSLYGKYEQSAGNGSQAAMTLTSLTNLKSSQEPG